MGSQQWRVLKIVALAAASLTLITSCSQPPSGQLADTVDTVDTADTQSLAAEEESDSPDEILPDMQADYVALLFEPNFPLSQPTLEEHYQEKGYQFLYREIVPLQSAANTYFAIMGDFSPEFYGGVQELDDGTHVAIFSVWDVNADETCWDCLPGSAPTENQISPFRVGPRAVVEGFGYEGTGLKSMIYDFNWSVDTKVAMLTSLRSFNDGSLVSAAFRIGTGPWEFAASFFVPTKIETGMPAGYAFLEHFGVSQGLNQRSVLIGPSFLANDDGEGAYYSSFYASGYSISDFSSGDRHAVEVVGEWVKVTTGLAEEAPIVQDTFVVMTPADPPDLSQGIELIEEIVSSYPK